MCGRVIVMAIGVINVPMCQSFLMHPVAWGGEQGRGDGLCLINMGEIPSANKGNVRFLIRPTCLKAALSLEDWDSWFLLSGSSGKVAEIAMRSGVGFITGVSKWALRGRSTALDKWKNYTGIQMLGLYDIYAVLSSWHSLFSWWECGATWNVSLPASTGCSALLLYLSDPQGHIRTQFMCLHEAVCVWIGGCVSGVFSCLTYIQLKASILLWDWVYVGWLLCVNYFLQLLKAVVEQQADYIYS